MKKIVISLATFGACCMCQAADFTEIVGRIVAADASINAKASRISADSIAALTENNLPDPEISGEFLFGKFDNKYNAGVSQSFDWPGLYSARRESALASVEAARVATETEREKARMEVASLLIEIAAAEQQIAVCSRILTDLNSLADKYRKMLADGNITVIDLNKLLIEIADYSQNIADVQRQRDDARAALQTIAPGLDINLLTADIDDFPALPLYELNKYINDVLTYSAEMRELAARREADLANMRVAAMAGRPGFTLGYRYANEDAHSYNGFEVGMTLPVFSKRNASAAAIAAAEATDVEVEALKSKLTSDVTATYKRADALRDCIAAYGNAITATDNVAILKRSFDAGQITLTDYVADTRYFIEAELRLIDLRMAYTEAVLSLDLRSRPW